MWVFEKWKLYIHCLQDYVIPLMAATACTASHMQPAWLTVHGPVYSSYGYQYKIPLLCCYRSRYPSRSAMTSESDGSRTLVHVLAFCSTLNPPQSRLFLMFTSFHVISCFCLSSHILSLRKLPLPLPPIHEISSWRVFSIKFAVFYFMDELG